MKKIMLAVVVVIAAGGYTMTQMDVQPERTQVSVPVTLDQLQE